MNLPAHDVDAERAVIGAVLYSGGRWLTQLDLTAEDFFHQPHAELWQIVHDLAAAGEPVEPAAVLARSDRKQIHSPALIACVEAATTSPAFYAEQLRSHTLRRRIGLAAGRLERLADPESGEFGDAELVELARGIVDEQTRTGPQGSGGATSFADAVLAGIDRWNTPDTDVLSTGWTDLDRALNGGLRPGHLVVIGARPGVGKSLMATELARNVASHGTGVLFSSLEMSSAEVTDRICSALTHVPLSTLTGGRANDDQMDALGRLLGRVAEWPLAIDDRASVGVTAIRGRARDLTRSTVGVGLVIVDYLQLVTPADPKASREQQVASVSRGLKLLAKDLRVPVVALSQINRAPTMRADRRPTMSDLRESGAIEADADEIWLLHRDEDDTPDELEVNVVKNRHGATDLVRLGWSPHAGRINNLAWGVA